ncbi:uncharacterized protein LOC127750393 [Frankliniella occidentalis]|uniref:Uncharacterized protein LOC127750393 n=1 Tax=Frankliniella occidentalis TaxID=133901 RepID=A0A9C6X2N0_FRAOC|nr:uncharacterized protein LOC127750393 [Frankliniella occidentalis]
MKAHVVFDLNEIVQKKKAQIAQKKEAAKLDDVAFAIKERRKAGFRVMNLSANGKDLSHWCPTCNTKQSKLVDHINKPPKTGKCGEAHKNMDVAKVLHFLKAQNSRGMRGPFYIPSIVDELLAANGDRKKMESIVGNVLSNVGVGHARTESDAILVYDMAQCFRIDWVSVLKGAAVSGSL